MAITLLGKPAAASIYADVRNKARALISSGVTPTLAIFRVGESPDALSYERGITRACERANVSVKHLSFESSVTGAVFCGAVSRAAADGGIHGIIILNPLPAHIDPAAVKSEIPPQKDVDGATALSLAGVFSGTSEGFSPCTAEAVIRLLDFYDIPLAGKKVTIVGRSLVVGRPAAMLLLARDATVTLCHTKTEDLAETCRGADIVVAAAGSAQLLGGEHLGAGQTVVDCGVNVTPEGRLLGDVAFDEVFETLEAVSPVPGGVGAVTSAVLAAHVVAAASAAR